MPKRQRTAKQLANDQRLREEAAKRRAEKEVKPPTESQDETITIGKSELEDLKRQIAEIKSSQTLNQPQQQSPQFGASGNLIGVFEKYIVDPSNYPDPSERLYNEPGLKRYRDSFKHDYFLVWKVETSQYETKDGRNVKEPKFTLELWVNMFDEDGDLQKDSLGRVKRFRYKTFVWHEDPQAAIVVARENGLDIKEWDDTTIDRSQKAFLDEMRYLRVRDMLLDGFFPKKAESTQRTREEVIGNRLVEVRAFATEASTPTLSFDEIG